MSMGKSLVYFDLEVDGQPFGRIVFRLHDDVVPRTAQNFRDLALGHLGYGYQGSPIHRIVPDFMIQGGDITKKDGTGGRSIYGPTFRDESFRVRHSKPGVLSMANRGPNSNTSQYFITTCAAPWLDGRNVAFGEVESGLDVVKAIQKKYASDDILRRPSAKIVISKSGLLPPSHH
ncbi:hypothetical protein SISSUDRAFT_1004643 [Sistotremastrum suecicum HHB10207 ss-3]|uniref:Peptidyl-prolyl cis-trans isomerase n=1 Tax=Sistotremastrum suecicum HHB10207 ss-3 TaxID=1314776 RepID=A0A166DIV5_9AGAM|nr:hypothetical protein SISSUDRAFT_1004643 [Sistotremastrum suecicum HHB10207 ss-3]